MTEPTEETNEQYLDRIFPREIYETEQGSAEQAVFCGLPLPRDNFRTFILEYMSAVKERPSARKLALMLTKYKVMRELGRSVWVAALVCKDDSSALPFSYTDDICQIGEHDVCFSGIELTKDIGEFKVGEKFSGATIDFQGGHLTLETRAGREHRYSFVLKVGAKHEGHTCTGCAGRVGEPCRQHAGS